MKSTEFNKVVLSIHAHPDDAEAWNAGTLKLLKDKGYKIVIATLTGGNLGGCNMGMEQTTKMRNEEARKAGAQLIREGKAAGTKKKTLIFLNNRLEGNALNSIAAMIEGSS